MEKSREKSKILSKLELRKKQDYVDGRFDHDHDSLTTGQNVNLKINNEI
jgi:hypothetical protein